MIRNIALVVVYNIKKQKNVINCRMVDLSSGPKKIYSKLQFDAGLLKTIKN